jgi:HEPN domain-containing protein
MPVPGDWADPFREQAEEDLRAAQASYTHGCESAFCMLLQMVFEKLAKAAIARRGTDPPHSHQVASRLLLLLARTPGGPQLPRYGDRVLSAIKELEDAHPSVVRNAMRNFGVAQYPQLEYPWENPHTGAVEWPSQHLPIAQRVRDPRQRIGADLLKFASALAHQFDTLFP